MANSKFKVEVEEGAKNEVQEMIMANGSRKDYSEVNMKDKNVIGVVVNWNMNYRQTDGVANPNGQSPLFGIAHEFLGHGFQQLYDG